MLLVRDWNVKVGSQEIPGVTDNFVWRTKGSRAKANLILSRECTSHSKHRLLFNNTKEDFTYGYHQMVNAEIKLITFFVAKYGKAVYNQQKQDLELTVAQIISFS